MATSHIKFMKVRRPAYIFSILLTIACIASLMFKGLTFGLDFTGGTLINVEFSEDANLDEIRSWLMEDEYESAVVQQFGRSNEVVIRIPPQKNNAQAASDTNLGQQVFQAIQARAPDAQLQRNDFIGPQMGEELKYEGVLAMFVALLLMMVYIGFRFKFKFAFAGVVALFHDALVVLGVFSLFELPFDQTVLAAVLAVIGYSINDTIVIFDRIRENFIADPDQDIGDIIDLSLNQTLFRTIMLSTTVLLVLFALLFAGGEAVYFFALALIIGTFFGTYSSVYIASNLLMTQKLSKDDFMDKEREAIDDLP